MTLWGVEDMGAKGMVCLFKSGSLYRTAVAFGRRYGIQLGFEDTPEWYAFPLRAFRWQTVIFSGSRGSSANISGSPLRAMSFTAFCGVANLI